MSLFGSITKAIGDVISPVSSLVTGGLGLLGTSMTNSAASANVQQQEQFQADMSGTAYQRAVADMQKAGLNPMLAYSQGGASTPSGSVAPVQNVLGNAVSSAQAQYMLDQNLKNAKAQEDQIKSQTVLNSNLAAKAQADSAVSKASAANIAAQLPSVVNTAISSKNESNIINSWYGRNIVAPLQSVFDLIGHVFGNSAKVQSVISGGN